MDNHNWGCVAPWACISYFLGFFSRKQNTMRLQVTICTILHRANARVSRDTRWAISIGCCYWILHKILAIYFNPFSSNTRKFIYHSCSWYWSHVQIHRSDVHGLIGDQLCVSISFHTSLSDTLGFCQGLAQLTSFAVTVNILSTSSTSSVNVGRSFGW